MHRPAHALISLAIALSGLLTLAPTANSQESGPESAPPQPQLNFMQGPATFPIGDSLAEIELSDRYVFLDKADTEELMGMTGNPLTGTEMATVLPATDAEQWFVVFEWDEIGYVEDEEADLDADALIDSIRAGTEAANEERRERGWETMEILGWYKEPNYDPVTKNLNWAIRGGTSSGENINRITKLLGRRGVMTVTLVSAPHELASADRQLEALLAGYRYKPGSTYAEFVPGTDRLAEVGLAALVVGGAGAALVKSGILARFWKWIVLGVVAAGSALRRLFRGERAEDQPITKV